MAIVAMLILAGTSVLGGFALGLVVFFWVLTEIGRRDLPPGLAGTGMRFGVPLLAAAVVFAVARSDRATLARWSREISSADFGWVLGTIVVIALGWLSTSGIVTMAIVAAAVLALGLAQQHHRTQMLAAA